MSAAVKLRTGPGSNERKGFPRLILNPVNHTNGIAHRESIAQPRGQQLISYFYIRGRVYMQELQLVVNACSLGDQSKITAHHLYRN